MRAAQRPEDRDCDQLEPAGLEVRDPGCVEREGTIGRLYDAYYVTTGNMANIKTMTRLGAEIAQDMKAQGVQAAILTAT